MTDFLTNQLLRTLPPGLFDRLRQQQAAPPQQQMAEPSIYDRPRGNLFNIPKRPGLWTRIGDGLRNRMAPVPSELREAFSPEDIRGMQRNAVGSSDPAASIHQQSGAILALRQARATEIQQRQQQRQRQEVMSRYAPGPNENPQQSAARLQQLYTELVRLGDMELAGKVGEVLKAQTELLVPKAEEQKPKNLQSFDLGGKVMLYDPYTGTERQVPKTLAPQAPGGGGTGSLHTVVNPATGQVELANYNHGKWTFTGLQPGTTRDAASTESERKNGALYQMAAWAAPQLDNADAPSRVESFANQRGLNEFLSAGQQKNMHAGRVLVDAYARLTSGAGLRPDEIDNAARMVVPVPGDTQAMIKNKRLYRQVIVKALRTAAGRLGTDPVAPVDPNEVGAPPAGIAPTRPDAAKRKNPLLQP